MTKEYEIVDYLIKQIGYMEREHEKNRFLFIRQEDIGLYSSYFPIEYNRLAIRKSDDIYYLFIVVYKRITNKELIPCFQIGNKTIHILHSNMKSWDQNVSKAILRLFMGCTSIDYHKRPENIYELKKNKDYQFLLNFINRDK